MIAFTEEYYDAYAQEIPIQFYFEWKGLFSAFSVILFWRSEFSRRVAAETYCYVYKCFEMLG